MNDAAAPRTCLIIDDDDISIEIIMHFMQQHQFEVTFASSAKEGLELCQEQIFSCIFLDWEMPEMSGIEFLEAFSQQFSDSPTKIVMVTSHNSVDNLTQAITSGATGYIPKPFSAQHSEGMLREMGIL